VLAGNLPLVGWHDALSTIIAGHQAVIKASSSDAVLITAVMKLGKDSCRTAKSSRWNGW
jgi:hypothetical protein